MESTRKEEERVKKETREGLEVFRKQQEEQDKKARGQQNAGEDDADVVEEWAAGGGRKRKRAKEKEGLKGVKVRRASTVEEKEKSSTVIVGEEKVRKRLDEKKVDLVEPPQTSTAFASDLPSKESEPALATAKSSLVAYGSDSDDD